MPKETALEVVACFAQAADEAWRAVRQGEQMIVAVSAPSTEAVKSAQVCEDPSDLAAQAMDRRSAVKWILAMSRLKVCFLKASDRLSTSAMSLLASAAARARDADGVALKLSLKWDVLRTLLPVSQ